MENNIRHVDIELRYALEHYQNEKFDIAMNSLLKVLEVKPKHDLALLLLGKIHEKERDETKEAHLLYERCGLLEAKLREALLYEEMGNNLLAAARLQQIIGDFEKGSFVDVELPDGFSLQQGSRSEENKDSTTDLIPKMKDLNISRNKKKRIAKTTEQVVSDAYFHFGRFHEEGIGVLQDQGKAIEYYEKSGSKSSLYNLAVYFEDIDVKKAIRFYEMSAALGEADAYYNLGILYETKLKDEERAVKFYRAAAEKDSVDACYNLGVYYDRIGSVEDAKFFYEKGVELGSPDAMYNLAIMYEEGSLDSELMKEKDLKENNSAAKGETDGDSSQDEDDEDENENENEDSDDGEEIEDTIEVLRQAKAKDLYMQAAKLDHADSLYNLGCMYDSGTGSVKQNHQRAFIYYQKAAKQDHKDALFNLACMFREGQGMDQPNYKAALTFFKRAHELGHERALLNIGTLIYSEEELDNMRKEAMAKK